MQGYQPNPNKIYHMDPAGVASQYPEFIVEQAYMKCYICGKWKNLSNANVITLPVGSFNLRKQFYTDGACYTEECIKEQKEKKEEKERRQQEYRLWIEANTPHYSDEDEDEDEEEEEDEKEDEEQHLREEQEDAFESFREYFRTG